MVHDEQLSAESQPDWCWCDLHFCPIPALYPWFSRCGCGEVWEWCFCKASRLLLLRRWFWLSAAAGNHSSKQRWQKRQDISMSNPASPRPQPCGRHCNVQKCQPPLRDLKWPLKNTLFSPGGLQGGQWSGVTRAAGAAGHAILPTGLGILPPRPDSKVRLTNLAPGEVGSLRRGPSGECSVLDSTELFFHLEGFPTRTFFIPFAWNSCYP